MNEEGRLYLFKIYNKDFSIHSKGRKNLHTLYWNMLFDNDNLKNVVYKLDGQAEIFFRKKSLNIEDTTVHKKDEKIKNKNIYNDKKESIFSYDIIKDKRYTKDTYHFHVPITLNFSSIGKNNMNEIVNEEIKKADEHYIIGIDRGERHLLYLTLIDSNANIIKQYSLNEILNKYNDYEYKTNYKVLLDEKEKCRKESRKNWTTIENIKEIKEGYLSQVIHKIVELLLEYNAVLVLEDLNFGFMKSRQKIEKQVYQKFEKMLITKLNYVVSKEIEKNSEGGLLNAYQLTNKFETFKKLGKQTGILFYLPARYTSKIDPVTGFVSLVHLKYENIKKAHDIINNFDKIIFNKDNDYFEFHIDYNKFINKTNNIKNKWCVCSYGKRIETFRNAEKNNEWDTRELNLTAELKKLFNDNNIDYTNDLKNSINNITKKEFYEKLFKLFNLTVQMRNSIPNSDVDYLISPVKDDNGVFFDSTIAPKTLPQDADANGAYNIARKGLWAINKIKNSEEKISIKDLSIKDAEWFDYVQNKKWEY